MKFPLDKLQCVQYNCIMQVLSNPFMTDCGVRFGTMQSGGRDFCVGNQSEGQ